MAEQVSMEALVRLVFITHPSLSLSSLPSTYSLISQDSPNPFRSEFWRFGRCFPHSLCPLSLLYPLSLFASLYTCGHLSKKKIGTVTIPRITQIPSNLIVSSLQNNQKKEEIKEDKRGRLRVGRDKEPGKRGTTPANKTTVNYKIIKRTNSDNV